MADDPSAENIELFTDLQEQFQTNGGYEAESVMARLADGLGLRQELLLEDIESLSGGQRRRVDLMRVLFQEPELMILDEPTNHLDRSAKRWLLDELARFPGALLVVSHDLKLLDHSITKVLHISNQRLTEWKGNYSKFEALHEADQSQRERASELEQREIKRLSTLADSMRARRRSGPRWPSRWTAGSTALRASGPRSTSGTRPASSGCRRHPARASRRSRSPSWPCATARRRSCPTSPSTPGGATTSSSSAATAPASPACCAAWPACRSRPTAWSSSAPTWRIGYFAQEHEQIDPRSARPGQRERCRAATERERRALLGSFGLPSKAADQLPGTLSGGERAKLGLAMLSAGESNLLLLDEPTNNLDPSSITAVGRCWATGPAPSSR